MQVHDEARMPHCCCFRGCAHRDLPFVLSLLAACLESSLVDVPQDQQAMHLWAQRHGEVPVGLPGLQGHLVHSVVLGVGHVEEVAGGVQGNVPQGVVGPTGTELVATWSTIAADLEDAGLAGD